MPVLSAERHAFQPRQLHDRTASRLETLVPTGEPAVAARPAAGHGPAPSWSIAPAVRLSYLSEAWFELVDPRLD
jgi:hypothetical protein